MPRMQVYLPDDLYQAVKSRGLSPSELLQGAVRAELESERLRGEAQRYVDQLIAEVGEPSVEATERASELVGQLRTQTDTGPV